MKYSARLDPYNYDLLKGTDFENDEQRAAYFYTFVNPPKGYYVDFPNPEFIRIKIVVNPCASKTNDLCC